MKNIWSEIRNDNYDDFSQVITIDAWTTDNDNEEGTVIASIDTRNDHNAEVTYLDPRAKKDKYAQEMITEARKRVIRGNDVNNWLVTKIYPSIGIDQPDNHDQIVCYIRCDVEETEVDPDNYHSGDFGNAFRRMLEEKV